jgi:hypothetical protein
MKTRSGITTSRATTPASRSSAIAKPKATRVAAWRVRMQHVPDRVFWAIVHHMRIAPSKFFDFDTDTNAFFTLLKGALKAVLTVARLNHLLPDNCVNIRVDAVPGVVDTIKEYGAMDTIYRKHFAPTAVTVLTGQYTTDDKGVQQFRRDGHLHISLHPATKQVFVQKWNLDEPVFSTNIKMARDDAGDALLALSCA